MKNAKPALLLLLLAFLALPVSLAFATGQAGPRIALKTGRVLTGRFTHEHPIEGIAKPLRSEGVFTVTTDNGLTWAIEKPMATTTRLSGGTLTQSVGPYPILQMSAAQMPFLATAEDQIRAALSGDWQKLKGDYAVTRKGDEKAWSVTLVPRATERRPFQKLVAQGGLFVDKLEIHMKKATDTITFSDQRLVENLKP